MRWSFVWGAALLFGCSPSADIPAIPPVTQSISSETAKPFAGQVVTLNFMGPFVSEGSVLNPFTDYRLLVTFTQGERSKTVRGYFAGDGNAAETSAVEGNVWRVKFAPETAGDWQWTAQFERGPGLARTLSGTGQAVELDITSGTFTTDVATALLRKDGRYFRFDTGEYWLKGGTNSPENLLGYADFDGTYRMDVQLRDGESNATDKTLHSYSSHILDWQSGDPVWQDGKGKGLIGAINYLSDQGMNAAYFLTFNIDGDGKDVWPFADPNDFSRFDVSKLDQWEIVFNHMQRRGVMLHMVIQETENELLFDAGETGPDRQLYLMELISRFAHHPALVWNLGEENGPVHWRPEGQTDEHRRQMIDFFDINDPYDHPVLLHTHSEAADKDNIAGPLLGDARLDGLSFQMSDRRSVNQETRKWHNLAREAGHDWVLTMDEIGMWHTGARPDAVDPNHHSLRRHALWGHLLAGGAGVEWYFGAKYDANDLSSEDWRKRENLWQQTKVALDFVQGYLPFWDMQPCDGILDRPDSYCFGREDIYALYLIEGGAATATTPEGSGPWDVYWFDPVAGGSLQRGTRETIPGGRTDLGFPPITDTRDWVVMLKTLR